MAIDFDKLTDSPHILDVLLQMEDVLDSLDIYVFPNWYKAEIVDGPVVRRHWVGMTLRWPIDKKPSEIAVDRLRKHNVVVGIEKVRVDDASPAKPAVNGDAAPHEDDGTSDKDTHWEITLRIPRALISDMNAAELDFYDDEVDVDDVQDAQDDGINSETSITSNENSESGGDADPAGEIPQ